MKMILKIQNRDWSGSVWLRSRLEHDASYNCFSISVDWFQSRSWRYDMQWSTSTFSRQWSDFE